MSEIVIENNSSDKLLVSSQIVWNEPPRCSPLLLLSVRVMNKRQLASEKSLRDAFGLTF